VFRQRLTLLVVAVAVLASALLLSVLHPDGALAVGDNTITPAILQARNWVFSKIQTFNGGLAVSGSSSIIDFGYDYSLAQPQAPTAAQAQTTGGTCSNANQYRFYVSWKNKTGVSVVSPASSPDFQPASGTTNRVTVTRPTAATEATQWNAWYSSSVDGHAQKKGCNIAGGSADVAIGTTTSECQCRTSGSTFAPTVATTRRVGGWLFNKDYVERPELATLEACSFGCKYATVTEALAAVTDASTSKRYVILIRAPYSATGTITAKSYVSFLGDDRVAARLASVTVPAGVTEVSFSNLTLTGTVSLATGNTTDGWVFFTSVNIGSPTSTAGLFSSATEKWHVVASDIVGWTTGPVLLSDDCEYYELGATWFYTPPGIDTGAVYSIQSHGGHGSRMFISGTVIDVLSTSSSIDSNASQVISIGNSGGSFGSQDLHVELSNVSVMWRETSATRTARTSLVSFGFEDADATYMHRLRLNNVDFRLVRTSTSGTVSGIDIIDCVAGVNCDTDNGHGNWSFHMSGGEISLTGGANRYDVVQLDTGATNLEVRLTGVRHAGNYNGTTGLTVEDSPLTDGKVRHTPLETAPATCSIGDTYTDKSGAFCFCKAANTWEITNATGSCV